MCSRTIFNNDSACCWQSFDLKRLQWWTLTEKIPKQSRWREGCMAIDQPQPSVFWEFGLFYNKFNTPKNLDVISDSPKPNFCIVPSVFKKLQWPWKNTLKFISINQSTTRKFEFSDRNFWNFELTLDFLNFSNLAFQHLVANGYTQNRIWIGSKIKITGGFEFLFQAISVRRNTLYH